MEPINAVTQTEIVQKLAEKLLAYYVFPDVAAQICRRLQKHMEEGAYAAITAGEEFAQTLTEHLRFVNQDEHLWVRWYPDPLPDDDDSLLQNEERAAEFRQRARLENYGIYKVERLPGNMGYVDIRYFYRPSWGSGDTAVSAMNFLAHTNALIIDLRQCRGGNPNMVALISSYLFAGEPVHLNSLYWREEEFTQQYWTLPYVPGQRFADKPVYILTSSNTFSAGEEFAFNLQTRQRATLVGETTSGGAHPGSPYRLHPHFEVFIPVGRAINPITHDNWEGRGVAPDVAVSQEQALNTAYRLALEAIMESIGQPTSTPLNKLLQEAQLALEEARSAMEAQ
ncbi:MAG: S41 family peptidase [Ardenticatenaceae bacterium]|nr:S41 family peptidase [Ardenticatenaceae bacterium]MCB9446548.1 S41 family peptidase [Ardenticatenaceae bacterium]